jgi:hypothetical protein
MNVCMYACKFTCMYTRLNLVLVFWREGIPPLCYERLSNMCAWGSWVHVRRSRIYLADMHAYTQIHAWIHIYIYTHTHTYTHTCIYLHIHTYIRLVRITFFPTPTAGIFCMFGSMDDSLPVVVTAMAKRVCMRPVRLLIFLASESVNDDLSLDCWRHSSTYLAISCPCPANSSRTCVCICMHVCLYIYRHMYGDTNVFGDFVSLPCHFLEDLRAYMYVYMYAYMYEFAHVFAILCPWPCLARTRVRVCMCASMHMSLWGCACVYICICICVHVSAYVCACILHVY